MRIITSFLLFALLCVSPITRAQSPFYHGLSGEQGLLSNEIYSIIQDENGFIWFGSDAGLMRYNGISVEHFTSEDQNSKSITGLSFSKSGRLYMYNFNGQVFFLHKNRLVQLVLLE